MEYFEIESIRYWAKSVEWTNGFNQFANEMEIKRSTMASIRRRENRNKNNTQTPKNYIWINSLDIANSKQIQWIHK